MPILTLGQGGMINMDRLLRNCVSEQVHIESCLSLTPKMSSVHFMMVQMA